MHPTFLSHTIILKMNRPALFFNQQNLFIFLFKFIFEHRFDTGFCSAGEHKVRPYIGFGHWLDFDYYDLPENL
jgi:hypothetical protein